LFEQDPLTWNAVHYHYMKYCLSYTLKHIGITFLKTHKKSLELSSIDIDDSHTPATRDD